MDNTLHQVSVSYDQVQDRLLLRVSNTGGQEFHYWLTRRFAGLLRQALQEIANWFGRQQIGADAAMRNLRQELVAHRAVENAELETPYAEGGQKLSGQTPLLLVTINIRPLPPALYLMQLVPLEGVSIDLRLDENLVHILAKLLHQGVAKAEWGLAVEALEAKPVEGMPAYRLH